MVGQTISRYQIIEKLGAGGMGEIYLAEDERLGRKLAIKILPEHFTQDPDRVRRFEQEARAASALNHPNIITIYEIGEEGGRHFIAAEYIEGETLRQKMSARRLTLEEALEIVIQTASALQAAHAAGITHRDIKPENIMARPDGYIKVLDFGLAKLTEQNSELLPRVADQNDPTRSLFETQPGLVIGTVAYMSPEQARGQRVDARTDIFSLGVVLYEMLAGERPFTGGTTSDMIASLLMGEPKRLSQHLPGAPLELERIVGRMLAKDRDARYQTAQELVVDLKRVNARLQASGELRETLPLEAATATLASGQAGSSPQPLPLLTYATNVIEPVSSAANYVTNLTPTAANFTQAGPSEGRSARSQPAARRFLLPALVALAVALTAGILALQSSRSNAVIDSIAVLPFVNQDNDVDTEYLSEGVAEGIINNLSQLPELSVASRNSVIRYKGKEVEAQVVGRELGVKAVLLGRIQRRGESLTINSELVDARTGRQIWGERFTRKIIDLMAVQEEITRNLAGKLRWRLTDAQKEGLSKFGTQDAEAYDLYLKGRYYWNRGTPDAMHQADEYFEAAAGKDPSYALAAAGCAACHAAGSDGVKPQESMEKAKFVAFKVLKADPSIVDAHLTLAQVNLRFDWDFKTAESEFKRAIELNPKYATAHLRYAEFLSLMGRRQEALSELKRARDLDPNSLPINQAFGTLAYYARDFGDAVEHLRRTIQLATRFDKDFAPAHTGLGLAYEQKGQTQDAMMEFLRARFLTHDQPASLTALKQAFVTGGREAFWQTYLSQLIAESKERYIPSSSIAAVHTRLGENDKAFAALDKALEEKDGGLVELKVEPVFEPLRAQTKFTELLRRIGLQ